MTYECPITGDIFFTPKKVCKESARQLFVGVPDPVKTIAKQLLVDGWRFYVVDQKRGVCYCGYKVITIPKWALNKKLTYKTWYICHEMAHAIAGGRAKHGPEFMKVLKQITPSDCIHHELGYKPRNASAAGIGILEELGF